MPTMTLTITHDGYEDDNIIRALDAWLLLVEHVYEWEWQ